ncbi:MAG: PepSY domain-containing protein [Deltaproteobacteria bacterium]|nr:PepSY domain-containing protein [Deltaproteobacteria bacterium]
MKKIMTVISGVVLAALIAVAGASAQQSNHTGSIVVKNDDESGFTGMAKISLDSAVNASLQAAPGKVLKVELENENGYLVYGVEIVKADRRIADVKVDAGSGKVLKIETDRKDNEGHEGEDSDNGREEGGERQ